MVSIALACSTFDVSEAYYLLSVSGQPAPSIGTAAASGRFGGQLDLDPERLVFVDEDVAAARQFTAW